MRIVTVLTLLLLLGVSYGLYQLKYKVEGLQGRAAELTRQTEGDQRAIKVLQAEWAYLTRPQRLQRLSDDFLHLDPVTAMQISALNELAVQPAVVPDLAGPDPVVPEQAMPDSLMPEATPPVDSPGPFVRPPVPVRPHLPIDTVRFSDDGVVE